MKLIRSISRLAVLAMIGLILVSAVVGRGNADAATREKAEGSHLLDAEGDVRVAPERGDDSVEESERAAASHAAAKSADSTPTLIENLVTLGMLILLQAVLGFDNLLYISIESGRAPPDKQHAVRVWGIGLAIGFRILLLAVLVNLKNWFETVDVIQVNWPWAVGHFNIHSLIVLGGGAFIIYTAIKEIWHMIQGDQVFNRGRRRRILLRRAPTRRRP